MHGIPFCMLYAQGRSLESTFMQMAADADAHAYGRSLGQGVITDQHVEQARLGFQHAVSSRCPPGQNLNAWLRMCVMAGTLGPMGLQISHSNNAESRVHATAGRAHEQHAGRREVHRANSNELASWLACGLPCARRAPGWSAAGRPLFCQ